MNPQERSRVHQLVDVMGLFRASIPTLPLHHTVTFLYAAMKPGLAVSELARAMGLPLATTSRHVKVLSGASLRTPGLVACGYGKDGRTKAVLLTDAGRNLLRTVLCTLEGGPHTVDAVQEVSDIEIQSVRHRDDTVKPKRIAWDPFEGC